MKNTSELRLILPLTVLIFFMSCASAKRTSKFTSDSLKPGITKGEVIRKYGKPYKESFHYDEEHILHEDLYYKENYFKGRWYEFNNILHFKDARLVSLEQGEEKQLYNDEVIIKK